MKSIRFSKTLWVNLITFIITITTVLTNPDLVTPQVAASALVAVTVLNAFLRLITDTPIDSPIYRWLNIEANE